MKKAKTLLAGLLLSASCLSHADAQLYYENSAAMWDSTQAILAFVTGGSGQPVESIKLDFEVWAPGQGWLNDHAVLPRGAVRVGFSNDPKQLSPNVYFAFAPWRQGAVPTRDALFGHFLLKQGDNRQGQRYLLIESKRSLVALGTTLYNRTSGSCNAVLPTRLYSGTSLDTAEEIVNNIGANNLDDPACAVQAGKVDLAIGIAKQSGVQLLKSFNYAVIDLGAPQRGVSVDNIVLYFAPEVPAAQ